MEEHLEEYLEIREVLVQKIDPMIDVYMCNIWDPLIGHAIIKEVKQLIITELSQDFPEFPIKYLPEVKIKINQEDKQIEVVTQLYFNIDSSLHFLSSIDYDGSVYDLYCRHFFHKAYVK